MAPSLESICEFPLVIAIANHPDVKKQIFSSSTEKLFENDYEQKRWENAINEQTSEILKEYNPILKPTFPRLRVKFIGIEMLKWTENLQTCFDLPLKFSQDFIKSSFFTSKGIIDEEKAARELVKEQSLSLLLKYKIACHFYLEDIIPNLWQELEDKEPNFKKILSEFSSETPMVMWSDYLEERKSTFIQNHPFITSKFKEKIFFFGVKNKNIASVKFSLDPEEEFRKGNENKDLERECIHITCEDYAMFTFDKRKPSLDNLLSKKFVTHYNFIEFLIRTMNVKKLLLKHPYALLSWFLYWPHQNQFIKIAQMGFEVIDEVQYRYQLRTIISFLGEENMNSSYNYRLLLKEFWIKSPTHFKKYVIEVESRETLVSSPFGPYNHCSFLILQMFRIKQFTSDDMQNVYLIIKEASPIEKKKIFRIQGKTICIHLCSIGNYKIADFFINVLELNQDTVKTFKKVFAFDFFLRIIKEKSTECLSDEFFEWILGTNEVDELKDEIFYQLNYTNNIVNMFEYFPRENRIFLVNKILKFFLKSDHKIEEWKKYSLKNISTVFSPVIPYDTPDWFDILLMYLRASGDKTSDIKRDVLMRNLPEIAKYVYMQQFFEENIIFLCLYKKERIRNFTHKLRSFYQDSIKHKICLFCMSNDLVYSNGNDEEFQCERHGTRGFISLNNINVKCSLFSICIDEALEKHQTYNKKSLKRKRNIYL